MNVLKFGGTSVKDSAALSRAADIISNSNGKCIVVVSALATVTNILVTITEYLKSGNYNSAKAMIGGINELHKKIVAELKLGIEAGSFIDRQCEEIGEIIRSVEILGEITPKSTDLILSKGEKMSSYLLFSYLRKIKRSVSLIQPESLIKTDSNYTAAEVDFKTTNTLIINLINKEYKAFDIIITGGFIGSNSDNHTTTLGRGGSDYSASVIASAINADSLEIWTDVDGIMTSDPRIVPEAKIIHDISYAEASELAYFGAKVLHPKTIHPAVTNNIPVYVKNTYRPELPGTMITARRNKARKINAIAFRKGITVINVISNRMLGAHGFLAKVFEIFAKYETSVDLVATSEVSVSLTIDNSNNIGKIKEELKKFADVKIKQNQAVISAVGEGIRDTAGISARFFNVLKSTKITMASIGASEINISVIVAENVLEDAVRMLHYEFFKSK